MGDIFDDPMNPTVAELIDGLTVRYDGQYEYVSDTFGVPVIVGIGGASYDGTVTIPVQESDIAPWDEDNPAFPIDLQEQADVFEAMLTVLSQREWCGGVVGWGWPYWGTIDKDHSFRSKPALDVVAKWFKWLDPTRFSDGFESGDTSRWSYSGPDLVGSEGWGCLLLLSFSTPGRKKSPQKALISTPSANPTTITP